MDPSAIPKTNPVRLIWELETTAPIGATWKALSDTDRFNRAAGLDFRFEEIPQEDGTTKRIGRGRRLGVVDLVWDELPFQYRAGEWFQVVRNFHSGPALQMRTRCRLKPSEEGTALRYSLEIYPRSALYRPIIALEAHTFTRPKLERALFAILDELEGADIRVDPRPPPLSPSADTLLKGALALVSDAKVRAALDEFIRKAPLAQQDRILPLLWASEHDLEEEAAIRGLLDGVRGGILTLSWELLCPSCLSPKHRVPTLGEVGRKVHCSSCNIHYDGTFPDSLSVNLRTSEALREFEVEVECIGSPGAQRHVVAQELLPAGGDCTFEMNFEEGSYRLRSWPPIDTATLDVRGGEEPEVSETQASDTGFKPFRLRMQPETGLLSVRNALSRDIKVIVERRQRPEGILTAARLLEMENVEDVLPLEGLRPDLRTLARLQFVVAVETIHRDSDRVDALEAELRQHKPRHVRRGERAVVGTFDGLEDGLKAAQSLSAQEDIYCALASGMVLDVRVGDEEIPIGQVFDHAMACLMEARPGLIATPTTYIETPAAAAVVQELGLISVETMDSASKGEAISWLVG